MFWIFLVIKTLNRLRFFDNLAYKKLASTVFANRGNDFCFVKEETF